jgi:hypothetical protein
LRQSGVSKVADTFVVFCPEKVAIFSVSGIITTNLGKNATKAKIRRARKDGYITPKYALLLNRRGVFFLISNFPINTNKSQYNSKLYIPLCFF